MAWRVGDDWMGSLPFADGSVATALSFAVFLRFQLFDFAEQVVIYLPHLDRV